MRSLSSLLVICLVSAIASAADEHQRNNFLRSINRRVQEDNNNTTNDSDGTTTATTTATTICEPCPVCDAQQPSSSTIVTNSTSSSEKIKLRFLVAERDFARLQVMLEQMADDYTRKASYSVAYISCSILHVNSLA